MEGLNVCDADLMVYIHPSKANKVERAIINQLGSLLFTYDETFDGVLLVYKVNNIQSKTAKILPGLFPYFGVKLKAKLLVFSPKPNMILEGKVVKLGKESIHVIVLGFSSAAIMSEDIREEFKYKIEDGVGVFASRSHKRHVIKAGSMIRFLVKSLDKETIHISGSLVPVHTGCIRWLSKHGAEEGSHIDRSLRRKRGIESQEQDHGEVIAGDLSLNLNRPHKSRRRTAEV